VIVLSGWCDGNVKRAGSLEKYASRMFVCVLAVVTAIAFPGVTYDVPNDWTTQQRPSLLVLTAPERDARIAIVDVGEALNADVAIAKAWRKYDPTMQARIETAADVPSDLGWDETRFVTYAESPAEHVVAYAAGVRRGYRWTVMLALGSSSTLEKRSAALSMVLASLRFTE
jgi:hypothetical protein